MGYKLIATYPGPAAKCTVRGVTFPKGQEVVTEVDWLDGDLEFAKECGITFKQMPVAQPVPEAPKPQPEAQPEPEAEQPMKRRRGRFDG